MIAARNDDCHSMGTGHAFIAVSPSVVFPLKCFMTQIHRTYTSTCNIFAAVTFCWMLCADLSAVPAGVIEQLPSELVIICLQNYHCIKKDWK